MADCAVAESMKTVEETNLLLGNGTVINFLQEVFQANTNNVIISVYILFFMIIDPLE